MAIDKWTATWYRVRCNRCGAVAPKSPTEQEAIWQAIRQGWQHLSSSKDFYSSSARDFCPECFEKWEAEQAEGWEEARAQQFQGLEQEEV